MKKWQVKYKVLGYNEEFCSGPYSVDEIEYHKNDIAGYEGIYDVEIVEVVDQCLNEHT